MSLINQQVNTNLYSMHRVVIIEDEFFAAEHLSKLIKSFGFVVVNIYHSGEEFIKETDWEFDIAVVDIYLADQLTGFDVAKQMNDKRKPFMFLTANQDELTLKKAASLSPFAYLSKPFKPNDVSVALALLVINRKQYETRKYDAFLRKNDLTAEALTAREIEVLQGIVSDQSVQEIADQLFISKNTVKYHTKNLYQKLNENSRI